MQITNLPKIIRALAIALAAYLVVFNIAMALFPIRPFWNDEWRLIYNLKFKTIHELWGKLDLLQECPRVLATLLKIITSTFDYSYTSLRLPALIMGIVNIFFIFRLRKKFLPSNKILSYLFALIIISSQTFTDYLTQIKHYEVEIFACLVAMWQLLTMLELNANTSSRTYLLLCTSFLLIPFFSYTYPIAIAPIFPVIALKILIDKPANRPLHIWKLIFPLLLVSISIAVFYMIDVKNLMADKGMYQSYLRMLHNEKAETHYLQDFWYLFALVGSGYVYEIVFAILGMLSFFYAIYRLFNTRQKKYNQQAYLLLYAVIIILITMALFMSGKLLGGVARLVAYTVPFIAFMIVFFLKELKELHRLINVTTVIVLGLFLGLAGNIISTCINNFTYPEYRNRITTYRNTAKALREARQQKLPLLYTSGIDGDPKKNDPSTPGTITTNNVTPEQKAGKDMLVAEVIVLVNPEYKVWDPVPLYEMPDNKWISEYVKQLPQQYRAAIAGDGINYKKLER